MPNHLSKIAVALVAVLALAIETAAFVVAPRCSVAAKIYVTECR